MDQKLQQAKELHKKGFNCAQAVAMPFCRELGMSEALAMRALEGFGAGMGGRSETCGALSGAVFVAGLKHSCGDPEAPKSKLATYQVTAGMCEKFRRECGNTVCARIKDRGDGTPVVSCARCIELGVQLASEC